MVISGASVDCTNILSEGCGSFLAASGPACALEAQCITVDSSSQFAVPENYDYGWSPVNGDLINSILNNCDGTIYNFNLPYTAVTTGLTWQSGPLGNYYLPWNSPYLDAGNTTADQLGLSLFTTQTSQVPEGNSVVDLGFHYWAFNPVIITGQPASGLIMDGTAAQFSVAVTAPWPLTYQWMFDGNSIAGATSSSYTIPSVQPTDSGSYSVVISDAFGSITSPITTLTDQLPIVITSPGPGTNTVNQPLLQLQGYVPEELAGISYDITNSAGLLAGQPGVILSRFFDTNQWRFTTNTFQAFDIALTAGANQITLYVTDLYGNVTTTNFTYTLDYSGKPSPVLTLYWPQNGSQVCGSSFTWRGSVDDPTATLSAQIVDGNGDTNVVNAIVERNGNFWAEDLPLAAGNDSLTLTATDAAGNVTVTNITVAQSSVNLTFTSVPTINNQVNVIITGTLDTSGYTVWVNGVMATQSGSAPTINWQADNVPVNGVGTAVFEALAIANSDNGGNGTGGGGGTNSSLSNPGNPTPALASSPRLSFDEDFQPAILWQSYYLKGGTLWNDTAGNQNSSIGEENWGSGSAGNWFSSTWANYDGGGSSSIGGPGFIGFQANDYTWDLNPT
jgi:hypothetical protein